MKNKWKPKEGEAYFFIYFENGQFYKPSIILTIYVKTRDSDKEKRKIGNCFKTKKEAQAKLKQILELLKK